MVKTIYLAGGCFWGMEHLFRKLEGVIEVTPGYANGDTEAHANYETVCTGITGFRETIRVEYDPERIRLEHLLFVFFAVIDPETPNRQGSDFGTQYQTGVYWQDPEDEDTIRAIFAMESAPLPLFAVECRPLKNFFPAEDFHQRYLERNPRGYCHIAPWRIAALASFPLSTLVYDRPAKECLQEPS